MAWNNNYQDYNDSAPPPPPRGAARPQGNQNQPQFNNNVMPPPTFANPNTQMPPPNFARPPTMLAPTTPRTANNYPGENNNFNNNFDETGDLDLENTMATVNDPFWQRRRYTREDSFPELADVDFDLPPVRTPLPLPPKPNDFAIQNYNPLNNNSQNDIGILASKNYANKTKHSRNAPQPQNYQNFQNQNQNFQNQDFQNPNFQNQNPNPYNQNQNQVANQNPNPYAQQQRNNQYTPGPAPVPNNQYGQNGQVASAYGQSAPSRSRHKRKKVKAQPQPQPVMQPVAQNYDPRNNWRTPAANVPNGHTSSFAQPTPSFTQPSVQNNYRPPAQSNEQQLWDNQGSNQNQNQGGWNNSSNQKFPQAPSNFPAAPTNWGTAPATAPQPRTPRRNQDQRDNNYQRY